MRRRHRSRYRDIEDRGALIRARLLAFATLLTGLAYLAWLLFALNRAHPLVAAAFYLAEVVCFLLFIVATFTVWRLRYKPEEGLPIEEPSSVDVFITVCREPIAGGATLGRVSLSGGAFVFYDGLEDYLQRRITAAISVAVGRR